MLILHVHSNGKIMVYIAFVGLQFSVGDEDVVSVRGILLDVTPDSPAKGLWLQMNQFNGYSGCSTCKEKVCQHLHWKEGQEQTVPHIPLQCFLKQWSW